MELSDLEHQCLATLVKTYGASVIKKLIDEIVEETFDKEINHEITGAPI